LFITLLFIVAFSLPTAGAGDTEPVTGEQVVRIGISEYPGYAYKDDNGNITGADVEYAYRIAQYANLKMKIVLISDAEDYFGALENGDVDMLFDAIKTQERTQKYLFADHEIGSTPMSVYVRMDDDRFNYGDVAQLQGKIFASEAGSEVGTLFLNWCQQRGFTPEIRYYLSNDTMDAALDRGDVDACLYGTDTKKGYRIISLFSPSPYYIIFRKDEGKLKSKIDDAMTRILTEDPLYEDQLLKKYSTGDENEMAPFSRDEKEYIANHPIIKIAVLRNDKPYFYLDDKGIAKGVIPDYYEKLTGLIGLNFEFVIYEQQTDAVEAVKNGDADVLGMFSDGIISGNDKGLRLTKAYTTVNLVVLSRNGNSKTNGLTVAVKERTAAAVKNAIGPDKNRRFLILPNAADIYQALQDGRADAIVCGLPSATWITNQTGGAGYNFSPLPYATVDLCGAVAYKNSVLCSILNKAISVSNYSFNSYVMSNTLQENTIKAFISRLPVTDLMILIIVLAVLVLALIYTVFALNRHHKERTMLMAEKAANDQQKIRLEAIAKSAEEKNQFFSNISHDMRTPLNAVIGFSALAGREEVSPKVGDYLGKIQASGNLLLNLINDTLTISKLGSGKLQLKLEPCSIMEVFQPIEISIKEWCDKKNIHFATDFLQLENRVIMVDQLNLQKIFLNLLSNAVKYTPEGGTIEYIAKSEIKDGEQLYVTIIVRDNGIGISAEFLPHLYEPFMQEQRAGYQASGTGLGLSIVKQLVELMDGTISVVSEKDKGTTFTVTMPFHIVEGSSAITMAPDTVAEVGNSYEQLQGKKVLICEDNELNCEIVCEVLRQYGIDTDIAENGQDGVRLFADSAPSEYAAILMDIRMPVMNGYEATRAIRTLRHPAAATIPIIAMTADVLEENIKKCEEAGMNGHLSKPLDPNKLFAILARLAQ
jgi:signal transduction histidine kinase/ABC-type amino acid transport substrate-binding protein/ActR/RegA family two-component response regulator